MKKSKVKDLLDFVPLFILIISAILMVSEVVSAGTGFFWEHIVGLCFLPIIVLAFWWRHKVGVLVLAVSLVLGLLGILSFSKAIVTSYLTVGKDADSQIPIFYGQPIFLLWLLIHFVLSARHYFGILTKRYWQDLFIKRSATPTG